MSKTSRALLEPLDRCFFCEPEAWRVIYEGRAVRLLAGAGPLCPGYVILAPFEHHSTVAALPEVEFAELQTLTEITKRAFMACYGVVGATVYEHGKLGACRTLEMRGDLSTYCHHAHRVLIPRASSVHQDFARWFHEVTELRSAEALQEFQHSDYVYYESCDGENSKRLVGVRDRGIPSQFMRRVLTASLGTGRPWNWAVSPNVEEMDETTQVMRKFFDRHLRPDAASAATPFRLPETITIDGVSYVGKTTLARALRTRTGAPVLDTGLIFRLLAAAEISGRPLPTPASLAEAVLADVAFDELRGDEITHHTYVISQRESARAAYRALTERVLAEMGVPAVVVGRDAWRSVARACLRIHLRASIETRATRRLLWLSRQSERLASFDSVYGAMKKIDSHETLHLLPPSGFAGVLELWSDSAEPEQLCELIASRLRTGNERRTSPY